jgi:hypothetical protein
MRRVGRFVFPGRQFDSVCQSFFQPNAVALQVSAEHRKRYSELRLASGPWSRLPTNSQPREQVTMVQPSEVFSRSRTKSGRGALWARPATHPEPNTATTISARRIIRAASTVWLVGSNCGSAALGKFGIRRLLTQVAAWRAGVRGFSTVDVVPPAAPLARGRGEFGIRVFLAPCQATGILTPLPTNLTPLGYSSALVRSWRLPRARALWNPGASIQRGSVSVAEGGNFAVALQRGSREGRCYGLLGDRWGA